MISVLFQLVSFLLFAVVGVFAIRRYITPQFTEALVKKYRELKALINEHKQLVVDQQAIEKKIADQEDEALHLFKKVNHWRNAVELQRKAEEATQKALRQEADEKGALQLKNYAVNHTYTQVAPLVVQRLSAELTDQYKESALGHEYLKNLLEKL